MFLIYFDSETFLQNHYDFCEQLFGFKHNLLKKINDIICSNYLFH